MARTSVGVVDAGRSAHCCRAAICEQNGDDGADHGWGSHHFVIGGEVLGGVYGRAPDLTPGSENDAGHGRLIPSTSVEQYLAPLLRWWGVPAEHLPLVLPNLPRFPAGPLELLP